MGPVDPLHVRLDIDETEAWRAQPRRLAFAAARGNPAISVQLSFCPLLAICDAQTVVNGRHDRASGLFGCFRRSTNLRRARSQPLSGEQIDVFIAVASGDTQAYLAPNHVRRGERQPNAGSWRSEPHAR